MLSLSTRRLVLGAVRMLGVVLGAVLGVVSSLVSSTISFAYAFNRLSGFVVLKRVKFIV